MVNESTLQAFSAAVKDFNASEAVAVERDARASSLYEQAADADEAYQEAANHVRHNQGVARDAAKAVIDEVTSFTNRRLRFPSLTPRTWARRVIRWLNS